ncbi:MAG TPA: dispase autolysis-inducing protein [Thermoanaerobaculia bacterium]
MMKKLLVNTTVFALTLGAASAAGAQEIGPPTSAWKVPACQRIVGSSAVTFTQDDGATLTPGTRPLTGTTYALGLVALDTPNTLLAAVGSVIYRSTDAGCRWTVLADLSAHTNELLTLTKAGGDRAYVWGDNRGVLFRIDGSAVTVLKSPVTSVLGIGVDPRNADHVRLGDGNGQIWQSTDAGATWSPLGAPALEGAFAYRAAFDRTNPDHILIGTMVNGAYVTTDGARTWTRAFGVSKGNANVFNLVISPADPQVVWAMGIDLDIVDTDPGNGRFIYRSVDGGYTFDPVIHQDPAAGIQMQNGPTMAAHPTDPGVFYYAFGMSFQSYGTDLYKYDAATRQLTWTHNAYHGIGAVDFSPADPSVLYLGLQLVQVN